MIDNCLVFPEKFFTTPEESPPGTVDPVLGEVRWVNGVPYWLGCEKCHGELVEMGELNAGTTDTGG